MSENHTKHFGQYMTPSWAAEALIERHFSRLGSEDVVIEPSCGQGAFLSALPAYVPAIGIDIDPRMTADARRLTGRHIIDGDFSTVQINAFPNRYYWQPAVQIADNRQIPRSRASLAT